jgi:hypothetical protein
LSLGNWCTAFQGTAVVVSSRIKMPMSVDAELSNCTFCELLGFCICTGAVAASISLECGIASLGDGCPLL